MVSTMIMTVTFRVDAWPGTDLGPEPFRRVAQLFDAPARTAPAVGVSQPTGRPARHALRQDRTVPLRR